MLESKEPLLDAEGNVWVWDRSNGEWLCSNCLGERRSSLAKVRDEFGPLYSIERGNIVLPSYAQGDAVVINYPGLIRTTVVGDTSDHITVNLTFHKNYVSPV